jgi:hypothetical protein
MLPTASEAKVAAALNVPAECRWTHRLCGSGRADPAGRRPLPLVPVGAVAQWSEQRTHNPWVVGSIPTSPTKEVQFSSLKFPRRGAIRSPLPEEECTQTQASVRLQPAPEPDRKSDDHEDRGHEPDRPREEVPQVVVVAEGLATRRLDEERGERSPGWGIAPRAVTVTSTPQGSVSGNRRG